MALRFSSTSDVTNLISEKTKERIKNHHLSWNLRVIIIHLVKSMKSLKMITII